MKLIYLPSFGKTMISYLKSALFLFQIFIIINPSVSSSTTIKANSSFDLCNGHGFIDSSPLNIGSVPWNVIRIVDETKDESQKTIHYIDISPCTSFENSNYKGYFVPDVCKKSNICHNTTIGSHTVSMGYELKYIVKEFDTVKAIYTGPVCENDRNFTITIRYICGNHLGHPTYPIFSLFNTCDTILDWETSAACNGKEEASVFSKNEMRCYVYDDQNKIRDLSPLIQKNGKYAVMADFQELAQELYINVCTDVKHDVHCPEDSSACLKKDSSFESIGSYKWSEIKFIPSNEMNEHEHVELIYNISKPQCSSGRAVTKIRFICPKLVKGHIRRYPVLISNMDCEYIIEWVTDYACSFEDLSAPADNCQFKGLDLNKISQQEYHFKDVDVGESRNKSILLNLCSGVSHACSGTTAVCLISDKQSIPIGSRRTAKFLKAENHLDMIFSSKIASCKIGDAKLFAHTIVELECDPTALNSQPQFIRFSKDTCTYKLIWKTPIVCPLFETSQSCSFMKMNSKNQMIQVDLSPLILQSSYYTVQRDDHDPLKKYALPSTQKIQFNVCNLIPSTTKLPDICHSSAVCLTDATKNLSFSLGRIAHPLTYDENYDHLELIYSGGFDPTLNKNVSTKIIFICQPYNSRANLVGFDSQLSQYVIEFRTVSACSLRHVKGNDCKIMDPITNNVLDLNPLHAMDYYRIVNEDRQYEFELNICGPVVGGSCSPQTAICQKEMEGEKRTFSLGTSNTNLIYWNSMLNMTFTNGDPYNDPNHTPRKSHISFICDPSVERGHPEFIGEFNRSYSFVWYTSFACSGSVPKKSNCVFENATHIVDLSPLSLDLGNHFVIGDDNSIVYINFCKSLNRMGDDQLMNCKASSAACLVKKLGSKSTEINLGEPSVPPIQGYHGDITILYNNGDKCSMNNSVSLTTSLKLQCDLESGNEISIMTVAPDNRHPCTYEFIVKTPIACPQKLTSITMENCVYTDKRTNLSADFSALSRSLDYELNTNRQSSKFYMNICKPVDTVECTNSAVCLRNPDHSVVSYGKVDQLRIYFDNNLHLLYSGGEHCPGTIIERFRSADIELICDSNAKYSRPVLYYFDDCTAKFRWNTAAACSLKVPSCSIYDDNGNYYSLRALSSVSKSWKVQSSKLNEYYELNVCKPLPINTSCGSSSAVCKCIDSKCKTSVGKVSDHEISIDPVSKHLLLTYEEDEPTCNGKPLQTQIQFQCSNETGMDGPKFVNENDCTHYFIWKTSFACPHNLIQNSNQLILDRDLFLHDISNNLKWDLSNLLSYSLTVPEERTRPEIVEHYDYEIKFTETNSKSDPCASAAICQTNRKGFTRDIGSLYNWQFILDDIELHMIIKSNTSRCGRNPSKYASSKIFFECVPTVKSKVSFLHESDDCEYYFLWKTSYVCPLTQSNHKTDPDKYVAHKSHTIILPLVLWFLVLVCIAFVVHRYSKGINIRDFACRLSNRLRRNHNSVTSDASFRYQQLQL